MNITQDKAVVLRGGRHNGFSVTIDFEDDDIDVIAVRSGQNAELYRFDGTEWRYDPSRLDSIDELHRVLEVPSPYGFETTRSLHGSNATTPRSTKMAAMQVELRAIGDEGLTRLKWRLTAMRDRGASTSEMVAEIERLNLELKLAMLNSAMTRRRQWDQNAIAYAKPLV